MPDPRHHRSQSPQKCCDLNCEGHKRGTEHAREQERTVRKRKWKKKKSRCTKVQKSSLFFLFLLQQAIKYFHFDLLYKPKSQELIHEYTAAEQIYLHLRVRLLLLSYHSPHCTDRNKQILTAAYSFDIYLITDSSSEHIPRGRSQINYFLPTHKQIDKSPWQLQWRPHYMVYISMCLLQHCRTIRQQPTTRIQLTIALLSSENCSSGLILSSRA